jgi:hypothetical protein
MVMGTGNAGWQVDLKSLLGAGSSTAALAAVKKNNNAWSKWRGASSPLPNLRV